MKRSPHPVKPNAPTIGPTPGLRPASPVRNWSGTVAEIAREVAQVLDLPQLATAANQVEWDDYEHELPRKTAEQVLEWLYSAWHVLRPQEPTEPPPEQEDPKYERARNSLAAFCQLMMRRFKLRRVTRLIIAKLEEATRRIEAGQRARLIVSVPPRVGKTQLVSRLFPAWFMGRNPTLSTMSAMHNTKSAASVGNSVLTYIKNPEYKKVFPDVALSGTSKSKTEFTLVHEGELAGEYGAYGRNGGFTGKGAHLLIIDDMVKEKEVDSEAVIEDAHRTVQALSSRLAPEDITCWIVVNTRYRENDVIGYILSECQAEGPWEVISAPLIADHTLASSLSVKQVDENDQNVQIEVENKIVDHVLPPLLQLDGEVLSETVWTREDGDILEPWTQRNANAKREFLLRTNPQEWWGQYQCCPVAATGNMVDPAWLGTFMVDPQALARHTYSRLVVSVDTGEGKNTVTGARSAMGVYGEPCGPWNKCVGCQGHEARRNACVMCRGSGLGAAVRLLELSAYPWSQPDQIAVLKAIAARWKPDLILIEDKSTGPSVAQNLRRDTDWVRCPVLLVAVPHKQDKVVRMSNALPVLRDGQIALPSDCLAVGPSWTGTGYTVGTKWVEELRNELLHFPRSKFKDRCDQLSQYVNWRTVNPMVVAGAVARQPGGTSWAEQSRRVSAAISGPAFRAF